MLQKGIKYEWSSDLERAFEDIKNLFGENIILKYADPKRPFILTTDASDYAIAAELSQIDDVGDEGIVTFVSRTLKGSECSYFTTEKEMLAIVWALSRLHTYLRGAVKVVVRTDHEALTFLRNCKFNNARLRRWNLAIQDFNLQPEYLPGRKNTVADYLSRQFHDVPKSTGDEIVIATVLLQRPSREMTDQLKNKKNLQKNDPYIRNIYDRLENNEDIKKGFVMRDDLVYKVVVGRFKIIIPEEMLSEFITEMHIIYGHIGARKIYNMMTEHLFAPRLRRKICSVLKTCDTCQKTKYLTLKLNEQVQPILTNAPNEHPSTFSGLYQRRSAALSIY